jgi:hypothetical protein
MKIIKVEMCQLCPYLNLFEDNWYCRWFFYNKPGFKEKILKGDNLDLMYAGKFPKFCKLKDYENN